MAERTNISWADNTWNPWRGGEWGNDAPRIRASDATFNAPLRWNRRPWVCDVCGLAHTEMPVMCFADGCAGQGFHRRRVFSLSLGDWLDPEAPVAWLADMLDVIRRCGHLDFLLLTKRPQLWLARLEAVAAMTDSIRVNNLVIPWLSGAPPANVWLGVSVEDQQRAGERIPILLKLPAKVRFLSVEPLLGPIIFNRAWLSADDETVRRDIDDVEPRLSWLIAGGESSPGHREMKLEWLADIAAQCR